MKNVASMEVTVGGYAEEIFKKYSENRNNKIGNIIYGWQRRERDQERLPGFLTSVTL